MPEPVESIQRRVEAARPPTFKEMQEVFEAAFERYTGTVPQRHLLAEGYRDGYFAQAPSDVRTLLVEVERLRAQAEQYEARLQTAHGHVEELVEKVERLREALAPFAAWSECYCEDYWLRDYNRHGPNCHFEDFTYQIEAARLALTPIPASQLEEA